MITDIFRSFFRTIGRILAYLFIGAIISWVFFSFKSMSVNAESIKPYMINIWGNSSIPFKSSVTANGSKNGVIQVYTPIALQQYHGGQNPRYLTIEVCAGMYADFEIYNTSTDLNYIDEDITITSVRKDCNNGYSSTNSVFYTIQATIGKWQVGITAGNTQVALASAYFKLTSKSGFNGSFRITNVTLSYDDNIGNTYQENVIMNNTDQIAEDTGGILKTIKSVLTGITNLPSTIANSLKQFFTNIVNAVTNLGTTIGGFFENLTNSIKGFFDNLLTGIIEGLKSLFVPTREQLQEIVNQSTELSENFGFVGQSIDFFLNIFTSFLSMVNQDGCIILPELKLEFSKVNISGFGIDSKMNDWIGWEEQQVCLSDNPILNDNITTIRIITSIVLVCMFVGFGASKFFGILSKHDDSFFRRSAY